MKTANLKVAQDLQKSNATKEAERFVINNLDIKRFRAKERLKILLSEEKEFMEKAQGGSGKLISEKKSAASPNSWKRIYTFLLII